MEVTFSTDMNSDEVCVEIQMSADDADAYLAQSCSSTAAPSNVGKITLRNKSFTIKTSCGPVLNKNKNDAIVVSKEVKGMSNPKKSTVEKDLPKNIKKNTVLPNPSVRKELCPSNSSVVVKMEPEEVDQIETGRLPDSATTLVPCGRNSSTDDDAARSTQDNQDETSQQVGHPIVLEDVNKPIPGPPLKSTHHRKSRKSPLQTRPTDEDMSAEPEFMTESSFQPPATKTQKQPKKTKTVMVKKKETPQKINEEKTSKTDDEKEVVNPKIPVITEPVPDATKSSKPAEATPTVSTKCKETKEMASQMEKSKKNTAPLEEKDMPVNDEQVAVESVSKSVTKEIRKRKQPPASKQRGGKQAKATTVLPDEEKSEEVEMEVETTKPNKEENLPESAIKTEPPVTEPLVTEPPVTEPPVTEPPVAKTAKNEEKKAIEVPASSKLTSTSKKSAKAKKAPTSKVTVKSSRVAAKMVPSPQKSDDVQKTQEDSSDEELPTNRTSLGLPDGWRREAIQRKSGKTAGKFDIYVYSPDGRKHRSRNDVRRYLEASEYPGVKAEDFNFTVSSESSTKVEVSKPSTATLLESEKEKKGGKEKVKTSLTKKKALKADEEKKTVAETAPATAAAAAKKGSPNLIVKLFSQSKRNTKKK